MLERGTAGTVVCKSAGRACKSPGRGEMGGGHMCNGCMACGTATESLLGWDGIGSGATSEMSESAGDRMIGSEGMCVTECARSALRVRRWSSLES